jgi:hypothetical protein
MRTVSKVSRLPCAQRPNRIALQRARKGAAVSLRRSTRRFGSKQPCANRPVPTAPHSEERAKEPVAEPVPASLQCLNDTALPRARTKEGQSPGCPARSAPTASHS